MTTEERMSPYVESQLRIEEQLERIADALAVIALLEYRKNRGTHGSNPYDQLFHAATRLRKGLER